ncbi:MAG: YihY/virulence factor BrkB family protein [Blastocatellia bacterium]|nr:YihY/virulence factor BrkB family protein [Blastocatellia bacterium]
MVPAQSIETSGFFYRIGRTAQRLWPAISDLASSEVYVLASAIAFNALLSFFPFAILMLVICRSILGWHDGYEAMLQLLRDSYLPVAQDFIIRNLRVVTSQYGRNGGLVIISLGTLAFTSAGIFTPIEHALNRSWKIRERRSAIRSQLVAFGLVFGCGALTLLSVLSTALIQGLLRATAPGVFNWPAVRTLVFLCIKCINLPITIGIFFLIYYCLPSRRPSVLRVLPTAVFVGIFWELAKYVFTWCLPLLNFEGVYGPFYITVTLVMWAFISAMLLLLGANLSSLENN